MSILTGAAIQEAIERKEIVIAPFNLHQLNPNSYNLRLATKLKLYKLDPPFDVKRQPETQEIAMPAGGYLLQPGVLYLGSTVEYTETHAYVPKIDGRSTFARMGLQVHMTAGFGDIGFCGTWTLEMTVVHPLRVYADTEICQISYETVTGTIAPYSGRYQNQSDPTSARIR